MTLKLRYVALPYVGMHFSANYVAMFPYLQAICELYDRRAEIWAFDAAHGARKLRTFHETSLAGFQRDLQESPSSALAATRPGSGSSSGSRSHAHHVLGHQAHGHHAQGNHQGQQVHRESPVIRLSYYGGGHYDSVVDPAHAVNVLHKAPGELEDAHIARAKERRVSRTAPAGLLPPIHLGNHNTSNSSSREALAEAQRMSDAEATERETLEQVLRDSRDAYIRTGYEDLEACLQLSLQQGRGTYATHQGTLLKEDPRGDNSSTTHDQDHPDNNAKSSAEAEQDLLRIVQEQSERDYYENAILSSLQADGKEDDSVLTEAELLNLAKQESEREARESEARFLGLSDGVSRGGEGKEGREEEGKGERRSASPYRQCTSANQATRSAVSSSENTNTSHAPRATELAHLSEEEALEMALMQSLASNHATSHTSTVHTSGNGVNGAQNGAFSSHHAHGAVQDEGFHTEEELLQMALQASMQGYSGANSARNGSFPACASSSHTTNSSTHRTVSAPATGYAINIGAPYVNVHGGGDYSEDMDEELMRAIEASLRK